MPAVSALVAKSLLPELTVSAPADATEQLQVELTECVEVLSIGFGA